ncbi:FHA domain-containing protein [Undibacterium jejuense]|uniref:FHA domain-containing protein n=1 Tax=Undibacterium jejuense TaxID=1344949 RepID=A0A923HD64_9BURK|nr:FHA domain-containing protein [Undibacterium jejuense]MBC3861564.1 FHA domain-containing protein [Undibacterium jejuense]
MSNICPKGHFSTDMDYCSECGAPIKLSAANNNAPVAPKVADAKPASARVDNLDCPDCMTPRRSGTRYCEVCRYDFELGASFNGLQSLAKPAPTPIPQISPVVAAEPPVLKTVAETVPTSPVVPDVCVSSPIVNTVNNVADTTMQSQRLKLIITVDSTLYTENDPGNPCPVGAPDREYHLDLDEQTLGRQFEGKGIYPEIVVQDPGISRRHLKLMRDEKGNHTVLDLGSANGTELNNKLMLAGVVAMISPGDELTLGMWTRIRVELR